ncbi:NUDIX hydrolase [bacterium]|nr:NUDIX hydrolase [bacterium]MBU1985096.1 NUDIX hydrolase [bacterium]
MILEKSCPRCGTVVETYRNPFPTTDVVLIREGRVLLIRRGAPPEGWALPGGFIDYGESAEAAARRELSEETGLRATALSLLGVYSEPGRDPRFHTLSVVYLGEADGELRAGDDVTDARWFPLASLPADVAFDHRQIVADAAARLGMERPAGD